MNNILPLINIQANTNRSKGKKDDKVIDLRHKVHKGVEEKEKETSQEKVVYDEYGPIHENSEARTKAWCEAEDTASIEYAKSIER